MHNSWYNNNTLLLWLGSRIDFKYSLMAAQMFFVCEKKTITIAADTEVELCTTIVSGFDVQPNMCGQVLITLLTPDGQGLVMINLQCAVNMD